MMFIQIMNHTSLPGQLLPIQTVAMIIKMASLLNFFIEIIIMIWEIVLNRKMRKLRIEGFEKISEEDRRNNYGKKFGGVGCMTFMVYLLVVILGMFIFQSRNEALMQQLAEMGVDPSEEGAGYTVEMGVVVNCT